MSYGICPNCGAKWVTRDKGQTSCAAGHLYDNPKWDAWQAEKTGGELIRFIDVNRYVSRTTDAPRKAHPWTI